MKSKKAYKVLWNRNSKSFQSVGIKKIPQFVLDVATILIEIVSIKSKTHIEWIIGSTRDVTVPKRVFITLLYEEFNFFDFNMLGSFVSFRKEKVTRLIKCRDLNLKIDSQKKEERDYRDIYHHSRKAFDLIHCKDSEYEEILNKFQKTYEEENRKTEAFQFTNRALVVNNIEEVEKFLFERLEELNTSIVEKDKKRLSYFNLETIHCIAKIICQVMNKAGFSYEFAFSKTKENPIPLLRQIIYVEIYENIKNMSEATIALFFNRNHATINHSKKNINGFREVKDPMYLNYAINKPSQL